MTTPWCRTILVLAIAGCAREAPREGTPAGAAIRIEGSSTVHPITKLVAERYARIARNPLEVKYSSTGAGFQLFCHGRTDINGASRPINGAEMKLCAQNGVEFVELPIAFDGIAVAVHRDNDWVRSISVAELRRVWQPAADGKVLRWQDVRPEWPAIRMHLVGPGAQSGTFDYFTKAIVGEEGESRRDYFASDDDDALVEAVARDGMALGFFGFSYYLRHRERLRALAIDDQVAGNGAGPIEPSVATIRDFQYQPLSRPLFLYASATALRRVEVDDFLRFYLDATVTAVVDAGYAVLPHRVLDLVTQRLRKRQTGSTFEVGGAEVGVSIATLVDSYQIEVSARH